jgi:hypothetical protein
MASITALAIRTYEPWTVLSALAGVILLALTVALIILAVPDDNR